MKEVKVPWTINMNNVDSSKMLENNNLNLNVPMFTNYFNPESINLFADGSLKDKSTLGGIGFCVAQLGADMKINATVSNVSFVEGDGTTCTVELMAILYGLISVNDSGIGNVNLNIFTDSFSGINMIRGALSQVESMMAKATPIGKITKFIERDKHLNPIAKMICHERLNSNFTNVRVYHIKAHCRDTLETITTFSRLNYGIPLTVYDAIQLTGYQTVVDKIVSNAMRAGDTLYTSRY